MPRSTNAQVESSLAQKSARRCRHWARRSLDDAPTIIQAAPAGYSDLLDAVAGAARRECLPVFRSAWNRNASRSAAQLRGGLLALSSRLLGLLSPAAPDEGVAAAPAAAAADSEAARAPHALEGRLCLRVYPRQPARVDGADAAPAASEGRLGPHCDSTLFTLLWSDAPGLQVLVL